MITEAFDNFTYMILLVLFCMHSKCRQGGKEDKE